MAGVAEKRGPGRPSGPPVHDDFVELGFTASRSNTLWLSDITERRTGEGVALPVRGERRVLQPDRRVLDRFPGRGSMRRLGLSNAIGARDPRGTIVRSDRGSQVRSNAFVGVLSERGLNGSVGRIGYSADNAAMEILCALLQNNALDRKRWDSGDDLRLAIVPWIEKT